MQSGSLNPEAVSAPAIATRRLTVLVLDEEIPYPLNSGKRIRTWNLLRHLAGKHDITFLCYGTPDNPGFSAMQKLRIRVVLVAGLPPSTSFRFYAGALLNLVSTWPYSVSRHYTRRYLRAVGQLTAAQHYDLIHCEWTPYASFRQAAKDVPMLIMAHNIETTVWRRRAEHASNTAERAYMGLQAWKMARFERRSFAQAARVATVTLEEQQTARDWGARTTSIVLNGVDTEYLQPPTEPFNPGSLLFTGSLDWQPNQDALLYFLREIFPEIQSANPDAVLRVVGRQPAAKLREQVEGTRGVEWVGEVPDIRPYFAGAAVVLVPLRIGGGSRIKILESLSMGKAVVTTRIGAEGLDVVSGTHCIVADTPKDFARSVDEILKNPRLAAELGRNGRELVVERYDWSLVAQDLERAWLETARSPSGQ